VKVLRGAAIVIILIFCCLFTHAQGSTNSGTEFWTAYMADLNTPIASSENPASVMDLYVTSAVNTTGTVSIADGSYTQNFIVNANQVTVLTIPGSAFINTQGISGKGIHITSAKPVAIYAHIFAQNSSGATLLLPVATLGKDYYSINYTQVSNEAGTYSAFMVIATEDGTTVEITPSSTLLNGSQPNEAFSVTLNKGQVYQGLSSNDLTGTKIESVSAGTNTCKKIAVFSGSTRIQIGCVAQDNSSDNLFQQVYPTAAWGKNYITVPLDKRNYDIFRIVLSTPNTTVNLNGQPIPAANFTNGLYYQFNSQAPNYITANQPVQVVQYAVSQGNTIKCTNTNDDLGDPEMIYLTPLEQTLNKVTLFSTSNYLITQSYINVVMPATGVASFMLDGSHYSKFSPIVSNPVYAYAQIPVGNGAHNISAGAGFNAIAYGFGVHESYGYAAGANLEDLNEFIALQNPQTQGTQTNGCTGVNYNLQLTLPYKTTNIQWDLQDGTVPYIDNNPVVAGTLKKGTQTLYIYNYPKNPVSYKSGSYTVVATVTNPTADACGSTENIEFDFDVDDPPVANFNVSDACLGDATSFNDISTATNTIQSWAWNFGDNTTSALQNPTHKYVKPGNYTVSLTVTDVDGCTDIHTAPMYVGKKPVASFSAPLTACAGQNITFTDQSASTDGTITQWVWNFGDGVIDTATGNATAITHIYAAAGGYKPVLTVTNSNGCISLPYTQNLTIKAAPSADFSVPDVCVDDIAQFTNKSTITDGTAAGFTYLWDFGDAAADASDPNTSTQKNPQHKYTVAGSYNVTLTVTSKGGCPVSKTLPVTVSGEPSAAFAVENKNNLCSSDDVIFDDQTTVNGYISKVIWYFDYNNNPQKAETYDKTTMPANRAYHHNYGLFNTPLTQTYEVKMEAYAGQTCISTSMQTIVINANPVVSLPQILPVCQGTPAFQIKPDNGAYTGTGMFTGPGISSSGLFNPLMAGAGIDVVNYVFTDQNGCSYTTSEQITVNPQPAVSVPPNVTVLEGNQVQLAAAATGNNLTYKWTPAIGLNNDSVLQPLASPVDDIQYTLVATSADNCSAVAVISVYVLKKLVIPNAFTPNGDGINDNWDIKYLQMYPNCTVDVFDRSGQKVFTSVGYPIPWDGTYKGSNLPTGTYYYIIDPKSGRTKVSGYVTIIR
jgi:gliding motility-associated-like protein